MAKKKPRIGRQAGTPNKTTTERAEIARIQNAEAQRRGVKLGKDMLEDYMMAFHNQAVVFQPLPAGVMVPGRTPNPEKFKEWGTLVVNTAAKLAEFQSPKFRAIHVVASEPSQPRLVEGKVIDMTDAVALSRVYQRMVKGPR